jgi:hypothetical protein
MFACHQSLKHVSISKVYEERGCAEGGRGAGGGEEPRQRAPRRLGTDEEARRIRSGMDFQHTDKMNNYMFWIRRLQIRDPSESIVYQIRIAFGKQGYYYNFSLLRCYFCYNGHY